MGCDASKSTDVIENEEIESDTFDFTDTQIDTIRSTWPILACDMVDIGSKVFLKIFIDEPKLKYAFPSFRYFDYIYIFWYFFFYLLRINIGITSFHAEESNVIIPIDFDAYSHVKDTFNFQ